jgi:hypothetical protein
MPKPKDILGQKFNSLTVVVLNKPASFKILPNGRRVTVSNTWDCLCDCGKTRNNVSRYHLQHGSIKTCGCIKEFNYAKTRRHLTEGTLTTPPYAFSRGVGNFYKVWEAIKMRCYCKNHKSFHNYGGRGIKVHSDWKSSYRTFAIAVGPRPSRLHSIDRIDTNKDYEPGNVRWSTSVEQANNKRTNIWLRWKNESITLTKLAEKEQVSYRLLHRRIKRYNMPVEEAVLSARKTGKPFIPHRRPKYSEDFC